MKIYTKTGDKGETGLLGGSRVPKIHPRVCAYGEVDELNSCIGVALSFLGQEEAAPAQISDAAPPDISRVPQAIQPLISQLMQIQKELFTLGSLLATPAAKNSRQSNHPQRGISLQDIENLEKAIDRFTKEIPPLKNFILPGGSLPGAYLHLARAVCRRAERQAVHLLSSAEAEAEKSLSAAVIYLNRLSDFLFTAARWANSKQRAKEILWQGAISEECNK